MIPAVANALGIRDSGERPLEEKIAHRARRPSRAARARQRRAGDRRRAAPQRTARRPRRSRCSPRAVSCCGSVASRASSWGRCPSRDGRPTSSWSARGRSSPTSSRPTRTRRRSPRSAQHSTARRSPSNSPPPGSACSRLRRSSIGSTMRCRCSPAAPATCPSVSGPSGPPSSGARNCSARSERELLLRLGVFRSGLLARCRRVDVGRSQDCERRRGARRAGRREPRARAGSGRRGPGSRCSASCASTPGRSSGPWHCWPTSRTGTRSSTSRLAADAGRELIQPRQAVWMSRLVDERDELRAAVSHLIETRQMGRRRGVRVAALLVLVGRRPARRGARLDGPAARARCRALRASAHDRALLRATPSPRCRRPAPRSCRCSRSAPSTSRRVGDAFGEALVLASLALAQLTQARARSRRGRRDACDVPSDSSRSSTMPFGRAIVGSCSGGRRSCAAARPRRSSASMRAFASPGASTTSSARRSP